MSSRDVLDTTRVAVRSRIDSWNRFGSETLASLSVETLAPESFEATIKRREIGDMGIVRVSCPPSVCRALPRT